MIRQILFSNLLVLIINTLLFGTFLTYILYFFFYKNKQQNVINCDYTFSNLKALISIVLGTSFIFFIFFLYYYYLYFTEYNSYIIFNTYFFTTPLFVDYKYFWFDLSVDFFGIILLFLGYFVGILSVLALDNRVL